MVFIADFSRVLLTVFCLISQRKVLLNSKFSCSSLSNKSEMLIFIFVAIVSLIFFPVENLLNLRISLTYSSGVGMFSSLIFLFVLLFINSTVPYLVSLPRGLWRWLTETTSSRGIVVLWRYKTPLACIISPL